MKITILYKFRDIPWGGANQFLKALKKHFYQIGCYVDDPSLADVLIFISYPFGNETLFNVVRQLKKKRDVIVVNRMYGPIVLYRGKNFKIDRINFVFNNHVSDGTILQSKWSQHECYLLGLKHNNFETVIVNAPDPNIFYPLKKKIVPKIKQKIKLISASWSSNPRKGFDIYKFLDNNLDFNRYVMTFVGNSPVKFQNIKHVSPQTSTKLADLLKEHDIFISASINDPCSNSLIEALHCGLPAVVRNSGGHPEIVGDGGEVFEGENDILLKIDKVSNNLNKYKEAIDIQNISIIGELYYIFCKKIYEDVISQKYTPKKFDNFRYLSIMKQVYWWKYGEKIRNKLRGLLNK